MCLQGKNAIFNFIWITVDGASVLTRVVFGVQILLCLGNVAPFYLFGHRFGKNKKKARKFHITSPLRPQPFNRTDY